MKPKTTKLYQRAWDMFTTFTRGVYRKEIVVPLSESHIIMFIAHMEERGYARVTIRTFISALSYPHKMRSLPDPARGWVVKTMLDTLREGQGRRHRLPIGEKLMLRMVKTTNRQWNPEKARIMTAIFMILYHVCLQIGKLRGEHGERVKKETSGSRQGREIRARCSLTHTYV